jgi:superfamily II DNA or RNA helicase/DNA-binding XRE family transcriptional regulator
MRASIPPDYGKRIKEAREIADLTQAQLAKLIGVSYASVNRWENGQSRPNNLAWQRIKDLELSLRGNSIKEPNLISNAGTAPSMDFSASPEVVSAIAEAHRLAYGHLFNPTFASETSLIDPLPHQRLAVYEHMLQQSPLRFLLADDAGAGKTIMTGLYVREMLARRLIRRILIVPPAGLVGNWEREMRTLFRMRFRVVTGSDARTTNPFVGPESDLVIVSVDTLAGERMFAHLGDPATEPYDLVVFDEAHKLSADRQPDFRVRKTERYRLAESIAGADTDGTRWDLPWSAQHLLLLTATPHMGKDHPYYYLWRLLLPETLPTYEAFDQFPAESRKRHFIRRTKEELVRFDGTPLFTTRECDTLSYALTQGPGSEQELYDATTDYISSYYNRARVLNRSAARLAMSVFQRRLASSTYALLRSFERRVQKIEDMIERIRDGRLTEAELALQQQRLHGPEDEFETTTADEQTEGGDAPDHLEEFEDQVLGGVIAHSLAELEVERLKVCDLLDRARSLFDSREESKFEKLREVLGDPGYAGEKFIIFTEHRDTADFLVHRLEGLGFTGQIATMHGGMPYQERERQVEFFRNSEAEEGARFLVATDAAGEGINLQFCWLMVNYDIPWNPARLEQRMGRIHRYGQAHDPVVVVNLVAGATREGRVLKTLLDKLEAIRLQLQSDKVFDVIGRLFEGVSIKDYIEQTLTEGESGEAIARLEGALTESQVRAIQEREHSLFGQGGDVARELDRLNGVADQEVYRRLLPGFVRRFVEKTAPLLDLRIEGDLDSTFRLIPTERRALDPLLPALESRQQRERGRLTVYRPEQGTDAVWMHPGEEVFDRLSGSVVGRYGEEGLRGSVFIDPYATHPYLFHIAVASVEQAPEQMDYSGMATLSQTSEFPSHRPKLVDSRVIGLRQNGDGTVEESPVEHLLLLKGAPDFAPGSEPMAAAARGLVQEAELFAKDVVVGRMVQTNRQRLIDDLDERLGFVARGFDYQAAELAAARSRLTERVQAGDHRVAGDLDRIRERQRTLSAVRANRLDTIQAEPNSIRPGEVEFLVHALVVPSQDPEETEQYEADVEAIAVRVATAYEESLNAHVTDVSRPELARQAGLNNWPGFDLLSRRPQALGSTSEKLAIEVKGRRGRGGVQLQDNEWASACTNRNTYWLYVVFDCATPHPRLVRVRDPFGKLLAKTRESTAFTINESQILEAAE